MAPEGETVINMQKPLGKQAGFTIIELMIALFVLTVMIATYVGANYAAQRTTEEMNERTIAIQDANRIIEQMRDASNTEDWDFPEDTVAAYPDGNTVAGIENLPNETITVSYASPTSNPLDVTITVAWTSYMGREHTEAVETYITQRG